MGKNLADKFNRAMSAHRARVFGDSGERHEIAIRRLKKTATWRAMMAANDGEARSRANDRLARQGY